MFNGAENRMMSRFDRRESFGTDPLIRAAHEKTKALFRHHAIDPRSFSDRYDPKFIQADLDRVARIQAAPDYDTDSPAKLAADILEGIVFEHSELSDWFGPHAHTIKTSEFDDIVNGIDLVVEFDEPEKESSHLALGVDATYGVSGIRKKFERVKSDIERNELARVKYFESSDGTFRDALEQVPRIVLGVEQETVRSLARLWTEDRKRELGVHPVQELFLKQARSQLVTFAEYARVRGRRDAERSYREALESVRAIGKAKGPATAPAPVEDRVHQEILLSLDLFRFN